MKLTIPTLAMAISLMVFACSESSPSSPSGEDSSSSGGNSSSSSSGGNLSSPSGGGISSSSSGGGSSSSSSGSRTSSNSNNSSVTGTACKYSGEMYGLTDTFACAETPGLQKHKDECEEDDGIWIDACPSGEKVICIDEEYADEVLKVYAEGWTCGDLGLKNIDGSEDPVSSIGGACGPYTSNPRFSMCVEYPELPASYVKLVCSSLEAPFVKECPTANARLICHNPKDEVKILYYFYSEETLSLTCEALDLEDLIL